jgi:hypothetical protein
MRRSVIFAALALAAIAATASFDGALIRPAEAQSLDAAAKARTARIVAHAMGFVASLTDAQRKKAMFAFNDAAQRVRWSNFPQGIFQRVGLRYGDLTADQRARLDTLLEAVLSPYGMQMVRDQMGADDQLKTNPGLGGGPPGPPGGPPGGGAGPPGDGAPGFGSDNYFVAFLGEPSATRPWMLQFGGHHLAINATVAGPRLTLSPSLTGGQPTKYVKDGKPLYIVETEVKQANAMLASLDAGQKRRAILSPQRIDLVLGPGHDGQMMPPEGLPGSAMTPAQKSQLVALIQARLGILNDETLASAMTPIRRDLDQTYFAWFGPAGDAGSAYFRVTGPTLVLEFSPQGLGGDPANHLHNMYRDPTNEYGAAWTSLK